MLSKIRQDVTTSVSMMTPLESQIWDLVSLPEPERWPCVTYSMSALPVVAVFGDRVVAFDPFEEGYDVLPVGEYGTIDRALGGQHGLLSAFRGAVETATHHEYLREPVASHTDARDWVLAASVDMDPKTTTLWNLICLTKWRFSEVAWFGHQKISYVGDGVFVRARRNSRDPDEVAGSIEALLAAL